jgi:2-keto-4-pentenoate hydratase
MNTNGIEEVAAALVAARRSGSPCDATPFAAALSVADDAFAVQARVLRAIGVPAEFPRWWKAGGPGAGGLPSHSALPPAGVWTSPSDARRWPCRLRLIEAEIAVRFGRPVTPQDAAAAGLPDMAALIDSMCAAIELVDSRWQQGPQAPALLKLADLQSHSALVLGDWRPFAPRDWSNQACTIEIGARAPEQRRGTHAVGDPLGVLPGLLRHMTRDGATVPAGTVVTTGTWCGVLPAQAGDLVTVRFDGIGEAALQL